MARMTKIAAQKQKKKKEKKPTWVPTAAALATLAVIISTMTAQRDVRQANIAKNPSLRFGKQAFDVAQGASKVGRCRLTLSNPR